MISVWYVNCGIGTFRCKLFIEAAFLLASGRRAARRPDAMPLGPIRSLHYFLPLVEELLEQPVPKSYVDYLRSKVRIHPMLVNAGTAH
jgi:hypothetical protein